MALYSVLSQIKNGGRVRAVGAIVELEASVVAQLVVGRHIEPVDQVLIGVDNAPAVLDLPGGETVELGQLVSAAHLASRLSVSEWNSLAADERERLVRSEWEALVAARTPAGGNTALAGAELMGDADSNTPKADDSKASDTAAASGDAPGAAAGDGASSAEAEELVKIEAAIATLDRKNKHHFTDGGRPQVAALEKALGFTVTAAQRDAAWAAHQGKK